MAMTADGYSTYMYDLIKKVMDDIGPRESCSEQERELGRLFGSEIAPVCEKVVTDDFTCSPTAFLGFFPYLVLMYLAGVVLYFFLPAVSVALALLGGGILFFEVVRYKELLDPLFPKRSGQNVSGYVKPRGESEKRVYVSAHLDSAYEFKLWYWFKGLSAPVMGIGAVGLLFLLGCSIARTSVNAVGLPHGVYWVLGWILVGLSPVVAIFAFFHTKDLVPGAMDDMAGIAVLAGLAKYFGDAMSSGDFYPQKTEVVLVGMSSEEAGLRGAKRYAARLREEPDSLPVSSIFLDGIYDERYLTIFTKEIWPGAKLDQGLVDVARGAAADGGFKADVRLLPLGATDASAFALAGIPAVSLCLAENDKLAPNYHTRHDTIEHVRPESLAVALQVVINMLRCIDA
jgi:hypothetical protein